MNEDEKNIPEEQQPQEPQKPEAGGQEAVPPEAPSPSPQDLPASPAVPPAPKPVPKPEPVAPTPEQIEKSKKIPLDPIARNVDADSDAMERRSFIKWLTVGWVAFSAVVGGYLTLTMRFLFPNVLFEPKQSFRAGYPNEYTVGLVSERWKDKQAVWIVRDSEKLYALSTVCTHLGCTPNWLENDNKFKCPCHGSGFYKTGINFEGPAPRPLERFKIYLADDGEIVVDKTAKFQQEKGEWSDPDSYITV